MSEQLNEKEKQAINAFKSIGGKEQPSRNPQPVQPIQVVSYNDLQKEEFSPLFSPVHGLITEGLTMIVGASKIGKSWLCLELAWKIATGSSFWGRTVEKCPVLYLALEDSKRRTKTRCEILGMPSEIDGLFFAYKALSMDDGFDKEIEPWILFHGGKCVVIVDVLQRIKGRKKGNEDAYQGDYRTMTAIKALADKYGSCFICIHHLKKGRDSSDPFERVSGSNGIMGVADTTIIIDKNRDEKTAEVHITGRDVYGDPFTIHQDERMRWIAETPEQRIRNRYESNPVVKVINQLCDEKPYGGRISYGDFRAMCTQFPYRDAKQFAKDLNGELGEMLRDLDGIAINPGVDSYSTDGSHQKGFSYLKIRVGE